MAVASLEPGGASASSSIAGASDASLRHLNPSIAVWLRSAASIAER